MKSSKSITIKDSIIIGGRNPQSLEAEDAAELKSDMKEAQQGLELLRQLKSIKREDKAGYQQIENEAKMAEAKIELMKIEAQKVGERREGELAALDLARTLNELRDQCVNDEAFAVKVTVEVLKNKVKDEKSLGYLETIDKMLNALYVDPFHKLEETHQTRVLELCNYIEEAYFASLVHGNREK
ncbi:hypothetical protein RSJ42_10380 [Methanosarcina hadiensis]|uniref:hypothetical protein n=1 Tax=Methanosarcina hadiensis TaxID=3078083 RepID=UPI0039773728